MTDAPEATPIERPSSFASEAAMKRLKRRHAAERRFRAYGLVAIGFAILALLVLVLSILTQAWSAFTRHEVVFDLTMERELIAPEGRDQPEQIASNVTGFNTLVQQDLLATFPETGRTRQLRREVFALTTRLAVLPIAHKVAEQPDLIDETVSVRAALSDDLDLYLKGGATDRRAMVAGQAGIIAANEAGLIEIEEIGDSRFAAFQSAVADLEGTDPSVLLRVDDTWFTLESINTNSLIASYLTGPAPLLGDRYETPIDALIIKTPASNRTVSDRQIAWTTMLNEQGRIKRVFNSGLFTQADSTYPELAGAAAAIVGSIFTMIVTALFAIPVGILAAVYLEEFAPKNRLTDLIEVNINNLAAVPSIVFGLLGAAVFLNLFGMPRSVPLVGGLVLGLLVLPTVIIASRAALKSVPPSIRTAALGLGASRTQAVFHHVLPLAAPGILTGAIIAMARALGETAPLLLIGMVAFVNEVPTRADQESTVLPVLIYKWFSGAERAWEPMTSAVIIILLVFLVLMNLAAVMLRRRFERRW
ncbi:MAG: phosphate ABC transporter permease PstA [Henriciella sp.]|nr:phosphate ABC transporter permease PstA [Henriciella sp.]